MFFPPHSPNSPKMIISAHCAAFYAFLTLLPLCRTKPEAVDVTFAGEINTFQPKEGGAHPMASA